MRPASVQAVCKQVYTRFPNLRGVRPKIEQQQLEERANSESIRYLLVFKTRSVGVNGKTMLFIVRAVADSDGKILKLTTSR